MKRTIKTVRVVGFSTPPLKFDSECDRFEFVSARRYRLRLALEDLIVAHGAKLNRRITLGWKLIPEQHIIHADPQVNCIVLTFTSLLVNRKEKAWWKLRCQKGHWKRKTQGL